MGVAKAALPTKTDVGNGAADAADWVSKNPGTDRKTTIAAALQRGRALTADGAKPDDALAYVTAFRQAAGHPYDETRDAGSSVVLAKKGP